MDRAAMIEQMVDDGSDTFALSGGRYLLLEPTSSLLSAVAKTMRMRDQVEVWRSSQRSPIEALTSAVELSGVDYSRVVVVDGMILGAYGVVDLGQGMGSPWALGTTATDLRKIDVVKIAWEFMLALEREFDYLSVWVDHSNKPSCRLLKRLGFTLSEPEPYGKLKFPFCHAERIHV